MEVLDQCKAAQRAGWAHFAPLQTFTPVRDITFDRARIAAPALSVQHYRELTEKTAGPILKLVESLGVADPAKLATFRRESEALAAEYLEENVMRQDYLMTRATKIY